MSVHIACGDLRESVGCAGFEVMREKMIRTTIQYLRSINPLKIIFHKDLDFCREDKQLLKIMKQRKDFPATPQEMQARVDKHHECEKNQVEREYFWGIYFKSETYTYVCFLSVGSVRFQLWIPKKEEIGSCASNPSKATQAIQS